MANSAEYVPFRSRDEESPEGRERSIYDRLVESSAIPDKKIKEEIDSKLKAILSVPGISNEVAESLIGDIVRLNEKNFLDSRDIFEKEKVVNKNFIKHKCKNSLESGNRNISRIALDVEGLKTINDLLGHGYGDRYLAEVNKELKASIEETKDILSERLGAEAVRGLEFIISAEGGDEFGILVIGPDNSRAGQGKALDLSEANFSFRDNRHEDLMRWGKVAANSRMTIPELLTGIIHDRLMGIAGERIVGVEELRGEEADAEKKQNRKNSEKLNPEEKAEIFSVQVAPDAGGLNHLIMKKYITILKDSTENEIRMLSETGSKKDQIFKDLAKKYPERIKSDNIDLEKLDLEGLRQYFSKIAKDNQSERKKAILEKYKDYRFFGSASAGIASFNEKRLLSEEEISDRTESVQKTKGLPADEARLWAETELVFDAADLREEYQGLNDNKRKFKEDISKMSELLKGKRNPEIPDELYAEMKNLVVHSEVLSRNEEARGYFRDYQRVSRENEMLKNKMKELEKELRECRAQGN